MALGAEDLAVHDLKNYGAGSRLQCADTPVDVYFQGLTYLPPAGGQGVKRLRVDDRLGGRVRAEARARGVLSD